MTWHDAEGAAGGYVGDARGALQDSTAGARRFFNALAEEPETVAASLAPRLRTVRVLLPRPPLPPPATCQLQAVPISAETHVSAVRMFRNKQFSRARSRS